MGQPQALSHKVVVEVRKKRRHMAIGAGPSGTQCEDETGIVTVRDFKYFEYTKISVASPFGLMFAKPEEDRMVVLPFAFARSYMILTKAGVKVSNDYPNQDGSPKLCSRFIKKQLLRMFKCPVATMLRNINWKAAQQLLEQPGAFELMAYLDNNESAIGSAAKQTLRTKHGGKEGLDKKLFTLDNQVRNDILPTIKEIADELAALKEQVAVLEDTVAQNTTDISNVKTDISSLKTSKADQSYVDEQFEQIGTFVDERFEQIDEQFEQVDEKKADKSFVDEQFEQVGTFVDERFEQIDEQFEKVDEKKADKSFVDEQLEGKADKADLESLAQQLNDLRTEVRTKNSRGILRGPGGGIVFDDGRNGTKHIPGTDPHTNATNCIAMEFQSREATIGILPLLSKSRVGIMFPKEKEKTLDTLVHPTGPVLPLPPDSPEPDIVICDWFLLQDNYIAAKIVVDWRSVKLCDGVSTGPLPRNVYWGRPSLVDKQKLVVLAKQKLVKDSYKSSSIGHGSMISVEAQQKTGSGIPCESERLLTALLLGPSNPDAALILE